MAGLLLRQAPLLARDCVPQPKPNPSFRHASYTLTVISKPCFVSVNLCRPRRYRSASLTGLVVQPRRSTCCCAAVEVSVQGDAGMQDLKATFNVPEDRTVYSVSVSKPLGLVLEGGLPTNSG